MLILPSKEDNIPLCLPKLKIKNYVIQIERYIKFLGVLLDQRLTWKEHIALLENKQDLILIKELCYASNIPT